MQALVSLVLQIIYVQEAQLHLQRAIHPHTIGGEKKQVQAILQTFQAQIHPFMLLVILAHID